MPWINLNYDAARSQERFSTPYVEASRRAHVLGKDSRPPEARKNDGLGS